VEGRGIVYGGVGQRPAVIGGDSGGPDATEGATGYVAATGRVSRPADRLSATGPGPGPWGKGRRWVNATGGRSTYAARCPRSGGI